MDRLVERIVTRGVEPADRLVEPGAHDPPQALRHALARREPELRRRLRPALARQRAVGIAGVAGHLLPQPARRLEGIALALGVELHLGDDQAGQDAAVHVQLDRRVTHGHEVAHLLQPTPLGERPQALEARAAERELLLEPGVARLPA